jgi:hypothetical protein
LLRLLAAHGVLVGQWSYLGVLTVYAVQFRYDADSTPMELDRAVLNQRASALVRHVEQLLQPSS